jgi:hypothetical protein
MADIAARAGAGLLLAVFALAFVLLGAFDLTGAFFAGAFLDFTAATERSLIDVVFA